MLTKLLHTHRQTDRETNKAMAIGEIKDFPKNNNGQHCHR